MKILLAFVIATLCIFSAVEKGNAQSKQRATSVKVMSWNLLAPMWVVDPENPSSFDSRLLDNDARIAKEIRIMKNLDADVMCLQEVEDITYKRLLNSLEGGGFQAYFAPHKDVHWTTYKKEGENTKNGNAIFYKSNKFILEHSEAVQLSDNGNVAPMVLLNLKRSSSSILALCVHLEVGVFKLEKQRRIAQVNKGVERIAEYSKTLANEPYKIMMGDFNEIATQLMTPHSYVSVFTAKGVPSPDTIVNSKAISYGIDYIFVQGDAATIDEVGAADINDSSLDYENHQSTVNNILLEIMKYKTENALKENSSAIQLTYDVLSAYNSFKDQTKNPNWIEDRRSRVFRLGTDHLYIYAKLIFDA